MKLKLTLSILLSIIVSYLVCGIASFDLNIFNWIQVVKCSFISDSILLWGLSLLVVDFIKEKKQ